MGWLGDNICECVTSWGGFRKWISAVIVTHVFLRTFFPSHTHIPFTSFPFCQCIDFLSALALSSSLHNATFQNSNQPASFAPHHLPTPPSSPHVPENTYALKSKAAPRRCLGFLHGLNKIFKWFDAFVAARPAGNYNNKKEAPIKTNCVDTRGKVELEIMLLFRVPFLSRCLYRRLFFHSLALSPSLKQVIML